MPHISLFFFIILAEDGRGGVAGWLGEFLGKQPLWSTSVTYSC